MKHNSTKQFSTKLYYLQFLFVAFGKVIWVVHFSKDVSDPVKNGLNAYAYVCYQGWGSHSMTQLLRCGTTSYLLLSQVLWSQDLLKLLCYTYQEQEVTGTKTICSIFANILKHSVHSNLVRGPCHLFTSQMTYLWNILQKVTTFRDNKTNHFLLDVGSRQHSCTLSRSMDHWKTLWQSSALHRKPSIRDVPSQTVWDRPTTRQSLSE